MYWQVRIAAVRSLGLLKSHLAVAHLTDNFKHEISNLRKEVALALGEIGTAEAQKLLNNIKMIQILKYEKRFVLD